MKQFVLFFLMVVVFVSCQKENSVSSGTSFINAKWQYVNSQGWAYSSSQFLGPLKAVYPTGDYLLIQSDSLWSFSAHFPDFTYNINANNSISGFTVSQNATISGATYTFKKINDTLYRNPGGDTTHIRYLSTTNLVLYTVSRENSSNTGIVQLDSLKKF